MDANKPRMFPRLKHWRSYKHLILRWHRINAVIVTPELQYVGEMVTRGEKFRNFIKDEGLSFGINSDIDNEPAIYHNGSEGAIQLAGLMRDEYEKQMKEIDQDADVHCLSYLKEFELRKKDTPEIIRDAFAADLLNRFTYHPPKEGQPEKYEVIRSTALGLATYIAEACPDSRELALALTKLEEAVMWANAAIARNE